MTDETNIEPDTVSSADAPESDSAQDQNAAADDGSALDPAALQAKIAELNDQLLRSQAELENFRRRSHRELSDVRKYQSLPVVRDLLPGLDNLHRAVQSAEQTGDVTTLLEGIRMVSQQLSDTLKAHAAEPIAAEGKPFDPNLHEALSQVPTSEYPPMTVIQVVESGFVMHDRVVRPAKVIVSCAPPEPASGDAAAETQE